MIIITMKKITDADGGDGAHARRAQQREREQPHRAVALASLTCHRHWRENTVAMAAGRVLWGALH